MRHDAETAGDDGGDDRDVGAVPQETAVVDVLELFEAFGLLVAVDGPNVQQLRAPGLATSLEEALLDGLELHRLRIDKLQIGTERLVVLVDRVGEDLLFRHFLLLFSLDAPHRFVAVVHVQQNVAHVKAGTQRLLGADDGRTRAAEGVRDGGVKVGRELLVGRSHRIPIQLLLDVGEDVHALVDLVLRRHAQRQSLQVEVEGGKGVVAHVL
mmetsp:Transcript_8712/g.25049  ORF Transcript_8712/g.25049 Transcript_8712/m.25049 type:complete len:211 (-) Transcript_8712:654-1286(-)